MKLLIINYHNILPEADKHDKYSVSFDTFRRQVSMIHELNLPVFDLSKGSKEHTSNQSNQFNIAITFDDGYRSHLETAAPLLKELNLSATFFPITSLLNESNRLNAADIQNLYAQGFSIGSHAHQHTNLALLEKDQLEQDLQQSKERLEEIIGTSIDLLAPPYGAYNRHVLETADRLGFSKFFSTGLKINRSLDSVIHRWNIHQHLSIEDYKSVLLSDGHLPIMHQITFEVKKSIKSILGYQNIQRIKNIRNQKRAI